MSRGRVAAFAGGAALLVGTLGVLASTRHHRAPALGAVRTLVATGASVPTVAMDPSGEHGFAAWVAGTDVFAAGLEGGAPVRVNDVAGDAAPHEQAPAQVAVGPRGQVYVLWQNNTAIEGRKYPASDLRFSRSEDRGRTWSPAVTVNSDREGPRSSHTFHDLMAGPDGTLYASWIDGRARDSVRATHSPAPQSEGHHHDASLPGSQVRVARSTDGGRTWSAEMVVDGDVCPCCRTSLAMGPDGSVYVAWRKVFAGDVRDPVVARLRPGADRFDAPVRVHADGWVFPGCPHAGPSIAVSSAGVVHVTWYTGRQGRQGLWHAAADASLGFGSPESVLTAEWVPPSQAALAADGEEVFAVWDDRRAADAQPGYGVLGGAVEQLGGAGRSPAIAAAGGRVVVAWVDGGAVRVREAR